MRKTLAEDSGSRKRYKATFVRLGKKTTFQGYSAETILLKNITDVETNKVVTDHIWFNYTKGFEKISLTEGAQLEFEARVSEYKKGYLNKRYKIDHRKTDFKLSHPTRIKKIIQ